MRVFLLISRRLFGIATALSLLVFALSAFLWVRSLVASEGLEGTYVIT